MGVLDSVLRYKEQKDAEAQADVSAIPQAVMLYQQAKQQQFDNQIKSLTMQANLAKSGFVIGKDGKLTKDNTYVDPLDALKQQNLISQINARNTSQILLQNALNGGTGNLPPGSTVNVGGLSVPLNQKLTESEQSSVAGVKSLEPSLAKIEENISSVIPDSEGAVSNVKRTVKQAILDSGEPILTGGDQKLQSLQSDLNTLKSQLPFTAGGKQLTGTEKKLVFKLLNITGKSNETITSDLNKAFQILREKEKLATGGANSAKSNEAQEKPSKTNSIPDGTTGTYNGKPVVRKGGAWVLA